MNKRKKRKKIDENVKKRIVIKKTGQQHRAKRTKRKDQDAVVGHGQKTEIESVSESANVNAKENENVKENVNEKENVNASVNGKLYKIIS